MPLLQADTRSFELPISVVDVVGNDAVKIVSNLVTADLVGLQRKVNDRDDR